MTANMGEQEVVNAKGNAAPSEEARAGFVSERKVCPPPDLALIRAECLTAAEEAAEKVLNCVHPTLDSEEKRRDVIDYVQQLIQSFLNCEVVSYGSVPLKTYLPEGDIDLTVLKGPDDVESCAYDVLALLQDEERNPNAEYQVKETQFIDAEVKLVKCFVRNFVIDITFNQLGGLSTLCFLEQVDRLIGRNHLFKRSIILIKTWCYYESRILGAPHGLISTYALEILVLYIFHHFHSSLTGPLSALHKFLDYYSQFDWENYCISLKGPVYKSSMPDIVVKMPEGGWNHLLLSEKFMENCLELFTVPSRGVEANSREFQPKYLNIIDPLKGNNNLGRSVHRGNFYRIRSAFKFGACRLGQLLLRPVDEIADEIGKVFTNACSMHERPYINSIRCLAFEFGDEESLTESLSSPVDLFSEDDDMLLRSSDSDFDDATFKSSSNCSECLSRNRHYNPPSKSSTENGSSVTEQSDLSMKNTYRWCVENSEAACLKKGGNVSEDLCFNSRDIDSASNGGEMEAFNPLANLSGDYDGNIRSLLRGQLCHGFSFSSSCSPKIHHRKSWDVVRRSMPLTVSSRSNGDSKFDRMSSHMVSTNRVLYSGYDSCLSSNGFDGKQRARGTGTYIPHMNGVCMERSSYGRGKNKAKGEENHFHRHGHANGVYQAREMKHFENGGCEALHARKRYYGGKKISGGRRDDFNLDPLCRIQFGSIGNLGKEVISRSAQVNGSAMGASLKPHGSSAVLIRQRAVGQLIRLKNEDEFPPLCQ